VAVAKETHETHEETNDMDLIEMKIPAEKTLALVAHDNQKDELLEWVRYNLSSLTRHRLYATGTTGWLLQQKLKLSIHQLQSGPLGGDQQIGAKISEGEINCLIFFWDPLEPQPHDPDIKALLRLAAVWNIPIATNRATADFLISSPLMTDEYARLVPDRHAYPRRLEENFGDQ
jgi:methylglyoxal synthase